MEKISTGIVEQTVADFEIDGLPMDVFELSGQGLTVESLTSGHGLVENGASFPSCGSSCSSLP